MRATDTSVMPVSVRSSSALAFRRVTILLSSAGSACPHLILLLCHRQICHVLTGLGCWLMIGVYCVCCQYSLRFGTGTVLGFPGMPVAACRRSGMSSNALRRTSLNQSEFRCVCCFTVPVYFRYIVSWFVYRLVPDYFILCQVSRSLNHSVRTDNPQRHLEYAGHFIFLWVGLLGTGVGFQVSRILQTTMGILPVQPMSPVYCWFMIAMSVLVWSVPSQ